MASACLDCGRGAALVRALPFAERQLLGDLAGASFARVDALLRLRERRLGLSLHDEAACVRLEAILPASRLRVLEQMALLGLMGLLLQLYTLQLVL